MYLELNNHHLSHIIAPWRLILYYIFLLLLQSISISHCILSRFELKLRGFIKGALFSYSIVYRILLFSLVRFKPRFLSGFSPNYPVSGCQPLSVYFRSLLLHPIILTWVVQQFVFPSSLFFIALSGNSLSLNFLTLFSQHLWCNNISTVCTIVTYVLYPTFIRNFNVLYL